MISAHDNEEWKPIPVIGFEEFYEVSSFGRIRRKVDGRQFKAGMILKPYDVAKLKYKMVEIHNRVSRKKVLVHRMVAIAFLGEAPPPLQVRHRDGISSHNKATNLMWGTAKENGEDKVLHGNSLKGIRNAAAKLSEDDVLLIRELYSKGDISQFKLAMQFNICQATIWKIVTYKNWNHLSAEQPSQS